MKLRHLKATGVAGLKTAQMGLEESVSVVVGDAFSGKTSVRDAIGLALINVLTKALGWSMELPLGAVIAALGTSEGIGVVFGFFPARRAARLDPIVALRNE